MFWRLTDEHCGAPCEGHLAPGPAYLHYRTENSKKGGKSKMPGLLAGQALAPRESEVEPGLACAHHLCQTTSWINTLACSSYYIEPGYRRSPQLIDGYLQHSFRPGQMQLQTDRYSAIRICPGRARIPPTLTRRERDSLNA
jgi:hypothetical protein